MMPRKERQILGKYLEYYKNSDKLVMLEKEEFLQAESTSSVQHSREKQQINRRENLQTISSQRSPRYRKPTKSKKNKRYNGPDWKFYYMHMECTEYL